MKDYNQMAQEVFRRRDEYFAARKKKNDMLLKVGVPLCSLVLVAILGLTLWQSKLPQIPTLTTEPASPTVNSTENVTQQTQVVPTNTVMTAGAQDATEPYAQETEPFVPVDPVEKPTAKPNDATGAVTPDSDSVSGPHPNDFPPCSPEDATSNLVPGWTEPWGRPDSPSMDATCCTEATVLSTQDGAEQLEPTLPMETEPATGPLEITVGGRKYTAQTGDMVSYTAELYVKDLFESFAAGVAHGSQLQVVEVIDPRENDPVPVHFPNLKGGSEMLNYHRNGSKKDQKEIFVLGTKLSGYNFKEQKVLFNFDFMVAEPGSTQIVLDIETLVGKGGEPVYFSGNEQLIFENIAIKEYITITPADEIVIPTAPKDEEETAPPFTYPEESCEGDLLINCDGRTYAADVGQRITYTVELEAQEKFEDIQLKVEYSDVVDVLVPEETQEKSPFEQSMPYIGDAVGNYYKLYTEEDKTYPAVFMCASRISKYDFRSRKVFLQVDFIVSKPGELDLDLIIEEMGIKKGRRYFHRGEQMIFEGIEIYEYVVVH